MNKITQYYHPSAGRRSNENDIVQACYNCYLNDVQTKSKLPSPNIMLKYAHYIFTTHNILTKIQSKVKNSLKTKIFQIRVQGGLKTKIAPIFHPMKLLELIRYIWAQKPTKNNRLTLAKKQAAIQAMICLITGRRWTDITRLKWDNMTQITTGNGTFLKFYIPVSKTNMIGARIESVTLKQLNIEPCPVKMIKTLHYWTGRPTNGFVFPCLAPKTFWTSDPINSVWSNYRCSGHWCNAKKVNCLGHTSSNHSFGYVQRSAKKLKWDTIPTKHTFRRTCLLISKQLGLARDQINEGFGWVAHSDMIRHYTAEQDSVTLRAPSVAIANYLESAHQSDCLLEIPFINP